MKTIKHLYMLLAVMFLAVLPAMAQNTNDDKNKAIIETTDGSHELNTDDIQRIRFDGGKVTVVHAEGETTFDHTLRSLSFRRSNPGTLRLTATTSIATEGSGNRAQSIDTDDKLKSTWAEGDVVYVYADENGTASIGTLTPKEADWGKSSATLTGNINATNLSDGQTLYFSTQPRPYNFSTQDGTVESLFYFTATAKVTIVGANASVPDLSFERPIAIVKFTLMDKGNSDAAISAKSFTVHDGTNTYVVTPTTATNELFVGIPAITSQTVTLTATDGNEYYLYQKTGVTFAKNDYYTVNVKMQASDLARPLTFEATADGTTTITFKNKASGAVTYTVNSGSAQTIAAGSTGDIPVNAGDKVCFFGDNATYAIDDYYQNNSIISCSADCYVYGNIMSLISSIGFATATELTADYTFYELFHLDNSNSKHIKNHSTKSLCLPATTLTKYCYSKMFYDCTGLTTAPVLPATTLAESCYNKMFFDCLGLTTAPALPATTLAKYCYYQMFYGCKGLTTAPALPATTLAKSCYSCMFYGCKELTTTPVLPATTLAESCYSNMFSDCTNLTTAPALPVTTLEKACYSGMFKGCTNLTTAPALPATTLTESCYYQMFMDCTSLNGVTCLATNISATNCTWNWLENVATTGTFYKPTSTDWGEPGASRIPNGWMVINEGVLPGQFTVNAGGGKVSFSMGNLQYQANSTGATEAPYTGVWRFAGHQYEAIGSGSSNVSVSYDGWIDYFGWGSGNQPTQTSEDSNVYSTFVDWGTNAISNGGNTANLWRTLSESEWTYLIFTRPNADSKRGRATINGMYCYVLLPDDWTLPTGLSFTPNANNWTNEYTAAQWAQMEAAGAVCFPAAGSRAGGANNTNINNFNEWGCYWSSTSANDHQGYNLWITSNHVGTTDKGNYQMGASVRLVQNIISAGSISYATSEVNKLSVDAAFTNELTLEGDGTVTYARSDGDEICTVDENTGEVTLNGTAGTCTITATVANSPFYSYTTTTASYTLTVTEATIAQTPLTLEAKTAGTIAITSPKDGMQYTKNGGAKTSVPASIDVAVGDIVRFYGNGTNITSYFDTRITGDNAECYIYGNIMSLVDEINFATNTELTGDNANAFQGLFANNRKLYNHADKALLLPATTLADGCYQNMFSGCTNLTEAPALPATTLVKSCYGGMFSGCTGLTTAPELPATTLTPYCYQLMFSGCTSLNSVTCLATDISANMCTWNWLDHVAATGTFYKAPSMTAWTENSASGIPTGWTELPVGAIPGEFTINAGGGKVYFSQGNLQYQASTNTWRFAPNQYDMIGSDNANISDSYTGWIDLLGWGTGNNPTNSSTNSGDYSTFTDWGTNAISNGGNTADLWHTLTKDEWAYIFEHHTKGWSTVNGVNGYVIRPDGISTAVASSYTASEWAVEEAAGSVFLPAANSRGGTTFNTGSWGDYWSSTPSNSDDAYYLYFHSGGQNPANSACRWGGRSVRLVYETPYFQGAGTELDPYLISSAADWNYLAFKVNSGTSYAEKFFRQTANINNVTTMVGNSSDSKPFSGTYDGDGKTLNLDLNTTTPHTAPFRLIVNATIKNVVTTGSVHSTDNHPSGLVGETDGTCTIQNCRVGANVGGAQHSGGIVGHCYHANISIIGCVYSGTLTPASGQWTGGIIGWGGDGGGHTISISDCLFAGSFIFSTTSTKFHPIGILQNQNNTKYLSNTYYTLGPKNTNDDASFVKGLDYKGKFARSITAGTDVSVARTGATTVYNVSGITSYGTGILYDGVLYAGDGEAISLTLSHSEAPSGSVFSQYTVTGGGSLDNPTSNSPTLTMTDANQTINVQWNITYTAPTLCTGLTFNGNQSNVSGSAQNLVNAGTVTHGTIYCSTNGGSSWSTSVPQGTNAGTYTVHYKVEPNTGYSGGVGSTSLGSTTIAKANGWCTLSPTNSSGWGNISFMDVKMASFTVTHHGGGLSYVKGGSQQDKISVTPNGNTYSLTCTKKISSAVTITVKSEATTNYKAASATYTCEK